MKKVGLGIAAVFVLVIAGGFVLSQFEGPREQAKVGDCARITGAADKPKYHALDCAAEQANVKIAKVLTPAEEACPKGGAMYSTFTHGSTMCLIPNFVEGGCYGQDQDAGIAKVACGTANSVKVAKILNGSTDKAACGEARPTMFPEPAVTFCLKRGDT